MFVRSRRLHGDKRTASMHVVSLIGSSFLQTLRRPAVASDEASTSLTTSYLNSRPLFTSSLPRFSPAAFKHRKHTLPHPLHPLPAHSRHSNRHLPPIIVSRVIRFGVTPRVLQLRTLTSAVCRSIPARTRPGKNSCAVHRMVTVRCLLWGWGSVYEPVGV